MIKTITAYTTEVDDADIALEEIQAQIGPYDALLKNTVAIITCHYEFVHSGVTKAVGEALPFHVAGIISSAQSVPGEADILQLSLMILTSDDVEFDVALTPSLKEEPGKVIAKSYKEAVREEKPVLVLAYAPFMMENSGDEYVNVLTEVSGGIPCFGSLAVDGTLDFSNSFMIYDGEHYRDCMSLVFVYGNIQPKFFYANVASNKILDKEGLVTKSAGHVLMEVNERPVVEYLRDLGLLTAADTQYAMSSLPFLLDYNDGTPKVSKIFITLTPEKYAVCAGAMPEGSTINIATEDKEDILAITSTTMEQKAAELANANGLLLYSCISRQMTLGAEQFLEMDLVEEKSCGKPYLMSYSGGEICPTQISDAGATNRFHNNAFIGCLF